MLRSLVNSCRPARDTAIDDATVPQVSERGGPENTPEYDRRGRRRRCDWPAVQGRQLARMDLHVPSSQRRSALEASRPRARTADVGRAGQLGDLRRRGDLGEVRSNTRGSKRKNRRRFSLWSSTIRKRCRCRRSSSKPTRATTQMLASPPAPRGSGARSAPSRGAAHEVLGELVERLALLAVVERGTGRRSHGQLADAMARAASTTAYSHTSADGRWWVSAASRRKAAPASVVGPVPDEQTESRRAGDQPAAVAELAVPRRQAVDVESVRSLARMCAATLSYTIRPGHRAVARRRPRGRRRRCRPCAAHLARGPACGSSAGRTGYS